MSNDWRQLKVGDRIRLMRVPDMDLRQRDCEIRGGTELPGWTADMLEKILELDPVVVIDRLDEFRRPWFDYELVGADGEPEYHSLAIMENESWERVDP